MKRLPSELPPTDDDEEFENASARTRQPLKRKRHQSRVFVPKPWQLQVVDNLPEPVVSFTIRECYARQILEGRKIYEAFSASRKGASKLRVNCIVGLHWYDPIRINAQVAGLFYFDTAEEMVETLGHHQLIPDSSDNEAAVRAYHSLGFEVDMIAMQLSDAQLQAIEPKIASREPQFQHS